jgi:hypothetical protein
MQKLVPRLHEALLPEKSVNSLAQDSKKKQVKRRVLDHFIAREGRTRPVARAVSDRMEGEEESIFKASHSPDQSRGREKRMSTS